MPFNGKASAGKQVTGEFVACHRPALDSIRQPTSNSLPLGNTVVDFAQDMPGPQCKLANCSKLRVVDANRQTRTTFNHQPTRRTKRTRATAAFERVRNDDARANACTKAVA
jgi:hypothetical protein